MKVGLSDKLSEIIQDPLYQSSIAWGDPRAGHPEGTIAAHIADLEKNIAVLSGQLSAEQVVKLRLLAHTHDTFKGEALPKVAIADPRSHASLARHFLGKYVEDEDLLNMVQYHDEPFSLWRQHQAKGRCNIERFNKLVGLIHDWDLFISFCIIDGIIEGKEAEPLTWFIIELGNRKKLTINPSQLITTLQESKARHAAVSTTF